MSNLSFTHTLLVAASMLFVVAYCTSDSFADSVNGKDIANTINVADHGIVPGEDVTFKVNQLLETLRDKSDVTLVFPKGQYDFHPENAFEAYRPVANHDNGLKRFGFPLFDQTNITIDGGGSTFMFHGRMVPITAERCSGLTLKNFTINWIRSFHAELTVVESDQKNRSVIVEVDPGKYPYTISGGQILFHRYGQDDPIGSNIVFDPKTKAPIHNTRDYRINYQAKVSKVSDNRFRIEKVSKKTPPVGSVIIVYGVHPTSRLCPAIHVTNSSDLNVEDVTVLEAGGMGLIVERTNNVTLNHMVVTSANDRIVSTRADATHFIGCEGRIKIEDCLFEHMLDDSVNVHGAYVKIEKHLGERQFLCEISHFQQWGLTFAQPGDKVALLSRTTILPFAETTVENVKILNEHRFVLTVADVPETLPEGPLSVENLTWNPDLIMRNNTVRQNRARSVLVTTKGKVLIEGNYFSSQMHGILIEGDNNKWYESGAVGDVTIENNTFENSGFQGGPTYPLLASPLLKGDQHVGEGHYHRNIRFVGNTLRSFNGLLVKAKSVRGLAIEDNKIEFSTDYPALSGMPAIDLEYCDAISIRNNAATGFKEALNVKASSDTSGIKFDGNDGFEKR